MNTHAKLWTLVLLLALCLINGKVISAEEPASQDKEDETEWDVLLEGKADLPDAPGPDEGRSGDRSRRGRGGFGGRFGGMVDTKTLLDFLAEHEPSLAAKLKELSEKDPERFGQQLPILRRLYGPVIRQMERDPEEAKLTLKKMRLRFKIHKIVEQAKSADNEKQKQFTERLQELVGELFDVIIKEEQLRLERAAERLESFSRRTEAEGDTERDHRGPGPGVVPPEERGPGRGPRPGIGPPEGRGRGRGPGWGRGVGPEMFRNRLEQRQKTIQSWQERKEQIVAERIKQLLEGYEPFPWGR